MKKILVVDDEKRVVELVKAYLERDGYTVVTAYDGNTALALAQTESPELIILDLMLPQLSGWDVCRTLRQESNVPIIMLTARDELTDKVVGLELGADDYVTKPFEAKELVARVGAVLRRSNTDVASQKLFRTGDLTMDVEKRIVTRRDNAIVLTALEFDLLKVLVENPGRVFSRQQLLDRTQDEAYEGYDRTIDSHISNLRKKIEQDPDDPAYIITVRGVGYKLEAGNA